MLFRLLPGVPGVCGWGEMLVVRCSESCALRWLEEEGVSTGGRIGVGEGEAREPGGRNRRGLGGMGMIAWHGVEIHRTFN